MKRYIKYLFLSCILFYSEVEGQAQWKKISIEEYETAFEKVTEFYSGLTNYTMNVSHASYRGHDSKIPYQKIDGYFKRNANSYHSFLLGIHTIQNSKMKIVVDTSGRKIIMSDPVKLDQEESVPVASLAEKNYIQTIFVKTLGDVSHYRIVYRPGRQFFAYEIKIGSDHFIQEIILYYSAKYPVNSSDPKSQTISPKAIISFSSLKKNSTKETEFNSDKYILFQNNGFIPAKAYKDYKIIDTRLTVTTKNK